MNWFGRLSAVGTLALLAGHADAQTYQPRCATAPQVLVQPGCANPVMPGTPITPGMNPPNINPPNLTPQPSTNPNAAPPAQPPAPGAGDAFAQAPEGGTQPSASLNPAMFGDLIGVQNNRVVFVPNQISGLQSSSQVSGQQHSGSVIGITHNGIAVVAPIPYHASFKITENESPRPEDRVFFNYNYYNDVTRNISGSGSNDLHRETIGFEKTLLGGDASVGIRLPFQQLVGNGGFDDYQVGDVDLLFKYAFVNNRTTGDVVSAGMVLTLPTGQDTQIIGDSSLNPTIFQPFVGYLFNFDNWYVQGFSSVAVPTDSRDVTLLFNSIGGGFWMYRDNAPDTWLRGVSPTAEFHLNTPLNHRGLNNADPIGYSDSLDVTVGAHFLFNRSVVGVAVGTPLTGPKPYDVEVLANVNFRW